MPRAEPTFARPPGPKFRLNPRFTFLLYTAVALGTLTVETSLRTTLLWATLACLVVAHLNWVSLTPRLSPASIWWSSLIGALLTLPLSLLARDTLHAIAIGTYGPGSALLMFQRAVFIAAPLEEIYFRGCVQRDLGAVESTAIYSLGALLLYLPVFQGSWLALLTTVLGTTLLGIVFALLYRRWGLSAAMGCHICCSFGLFVIPSVLREMGNWLGP